MVYKTRTQTRKVTDRNKRPQPQFGTLFGDVHTLLIIQANTKAKR
jgi:hypothetical protein